ncbi:MAG: Bax inhibitor-1/YccA family protein [Actinobacteria bacterium]|nr:Bax inhibitor-1/YccA family protein [Actinomycetota bacterium]
MRSSNPVLGRAFSQRGFAAMDPTTTTQESAQSLETLYNAPAASSLRTGRMTIDDVVTRTGILFTTLVVVGAAAWTLNLGTGALILGVVGGFVLAMVNSFSKKVRPPLILAYAGFQGLALGTISHYYNVAYPGIVSQALIGTLAAFAGVLVAYRSGRVRVTPKFTRMLMGALIGYLILAVVSMIAGMTGVGGGLGFYGVSGLGLLLAVAGVGLASVFLILDFDQVEKGIAAGLPEQESWRAAFGLIVTLVWLYLEVLRLISILRSGD